MAWSRRLDIRGGVLRQLLCTKRWTDKYSLHLELSCPPLLTDAGQQMMPSPSTGNLTAAYRGGDDRFGGDDEGINPTVERGVPAEKEQLRRNLSLLKKKMHGQAGSRRSQVWTKYARIFRGVPQLSMRDCQTERERDHVTVKYFGRCQLPSPLVS